MRKLAVFSSVSLDGYFTDKNGDMSWAHRGDADPEWNAFVSECLYVLRAPCNWRSQMRAYVATTGVVFGLLFVVHVWRVIVEGTQLARDPFWVLITVVAAAISIWAWIVLKRAPRS